MKADFQEEILRYILQTKEGKKYIDHLDKELWDRHEYQVVYQLLQGYIEKYKGSPSKVTLTEYFDKELRKAVTAKNAVTKESVQQIERTIYKLYDTPFDTNTGLIHEEIIEYAQRKLTRQMLTENADKVANGDEKFFRELHKRMQDIVNLADIIDTEPDKHRGGFALRDFDNVNFNAQSQKAHPTIFSQLNDFTAEGGFYSPQLAIIMKGPKAFGTGLLLNLAKGWVMDGLNVYFADTENGVEPIKKRFYQAIGECTRKELKVPEIKQMLGRMVKGYKAMGGDFQNGFFPAGQATLADVDAELEFLKAEYGWTPHVIIYDYLDLFKGKDPKKDKRIQIQDNYHEAIAMNDKWNTFAFSISTVSRKAISAPVIRVEDFGEDIQKAYNCHAAFALCATEEEAALNIARILPVVQREGVGFKGTNVCPVILDQAHMKITETTLSVLVKMLEGRATITKPKKILRD